MVRLPKNAEMHEEINKPIFVVGSPRSGTSILAWCLGHHPNIFPVPESNWMGDFAVNVARSYQIGAARGIFSILSAMGISHAEFFSHIGRSINSLVLKHRGDLDRQRLIIAVQRLLKERGLYLGEVTGEFDAATSAAVQQYEMVDKTLYSELADSLRTAASDSEYKTRWVDQTPDTPSIFVVCANCFHVLYSSTSCATWVQWCALCSISIASQGLIWWRTKKKRTNIGCARLGHV